MRAILFVEVDVDGATFWFGAADRATVRMMQATQREVNERAERLALKLGRLLTEQERAALAVFDDNDLPEDMTDSIAAAFIEGIRGWEGVEGIDGEPLPFTPENVREFPSLQKVIIMSAYRQRRNELEQKRGPADGQDGA